MHGLQRADSVAPLCAFAGEPPLLNQRAAPGGRRRRASKHSGQQCWALVVASVSLMHASKLPRVCAHTHSDCRSLLQAGAYEQVSAAIKQLQSMKGQRLWEYENMTLEQEHLESFSMLQAVTNTILNAIVFESDLKVSRMQR